MKRTMMRRKALEASKDKAKSIQMKTPDGQADQAKPASAEAESDDAADDRAAAREMIASDRADATREYHLAQRAQLENMARLRALRRAAQAAR